MAVEKIILSIEAKNVAKTKKEINSLKTTTKGLNKEVDTTTNLLKKAAGAMAAFASIGLITKALSDMIKLNVEFEKTLTNVLTLLDATSRAKFGDFLETGALVTMRKYGLEVQDVNKALFDTVSAGIKAGNSIKFLDTAAKLAVGGVTDLSSAVKGMTSIMNAYGLSIEDANKVASAFFTAQKFGTTTVAKLVENVGMVAPVAKLAGIGFEEMLAAMTLLTVKGLSTEEATTGLRATINALINTTPEAEKAFRKMGIETGITAIRVNGLGETLLQVANAVEENADELTTLIPNVRALNAVAALGTEALTLFDEIVKAIKTDFGEASSLTQALTLQMETLAKQTDVTASAWKEFRIELGKEIKEGEQAGKVKLFVLGLRGWMISLSESMRESKDAITDPVGAMIGLAIAAQKTAQNLQETEKAIVSIQKAIAPDVPGGVLTSLFFGDADEMESANQQFFSLLGKMGEDVVDNEIKTQEELIKVKKQFAGEAMEVEKIKAQQTMDIAFGTSAFLRALAGDNFLFQQLVAIAESIVSTLLGAQYAFTWTTRVAGPIAGAAAKRAALITGFINTAVIAGTTIAGFEEGGFTGKSKYQARDKDGRIAGYVHEDEFVFNKDKTRTLRPLFEDIHNNRIDIHGLAALTRRGTMKTMPKFNADVLETEIKKIYRKMSEEQPEKASIIYTNQGYIKTIGNTTINVST